MGIAVGPQHYNLNLLVRNNPKTCVLGPSWTFEAGVWGIHLALMLNTSGILRLRLVSNAGS